MSTQFQGKGAITAPEFTLATIITGGGRGIGRAIALRMSRQTAVLVVGRTQSDLQGTVDEIVSTGGKAAFVVGDVSNPDTATQALAKISEHGWTLRNLVLNAGIAKGGCATTFSKETWRQIFDVNVHGAFWFIQACLPSMMAQKAGNICIISSIAGLKGYKYDAAYCASKHALVGMTRSLALEYAKHGISVVALCPGFVESDMTRRTIAGVMKHRHMSESDAIKLVLEKNDQSRIIPAEEVADAAQLVCSGSTPSLSGQALAMTGDSSVPQSAQLSVSASSDAHVRLARLVAWIRTEAATATKLLVPISGGSDSALVFWLCNQAYPEKTVGVFAGDSLRCRQWFDSVGSVATIAAPSVPDKESARWTSFLTMSRAQNAWLVGSRNRTEDVLGTFSMASRLATFLPIAGVWKGDVMDLCNTIGVPSEITESSRKADPDCGRPQAMAEIPLEATDRYLKVLVGELNATQLSVTEPQQAYLDHVFSVNSFRTALPKRAPTV